MCVSHHVGLSGLLDVVCGDDDRDLPRLHDLHQVLPDPAQRKQQPSNHTTSDPRANKRFLQISDLLQRQILCQTSVFSPVC